MSISLSCVTTWSSGQGTEPKLVLFLFMLFICYASSPPLLPLPHPHFLFLDNLDQGCLTSKQRLGPTLHRLYQQGLHIVWSMGPPCCTLNGCPATISHMQITQPLSAPEPWACLLLCPVQVALAMGWAMPYHITLQGGISKEGVRWRTEGEPRDPNCCQGQQTPLRPHVARGLPVRP